MPIDFEEIAFDRDFEEEILQFDEKLQIEKSLFNYIWKIICPCISGYLIKKSYAKLKYHHPKQKKASLVIQNDEYITLRNINHGSVCSVDLIYYKKRKKLLAVKKPSTYDSEYPKLFEREYENYSKLCHPFLPKFYGIIKNRNFNYLVIEYINGLTLLNIKNLHLDDENKITIIFELMFTLLYLHQNNFIFRDLKPDNIILKDNYEAYLIDFDRMINFDDMNRSIDSSAYFASPEIRSDSLSSASDIYSLGKMIYYIMEENMPNINSKTFKLNNYPYLMNIYKRCINENPKDRPSIKELFLEYYINYHSSILYVGFFDMFEDYFCNIYSESIINTMNFIYDKDSLFYIGIMYYEGKYIMQDINKAIHYFTLASNQNVSNAQFNLGIIYYEGEYVKQDINKAI